MTFLFVKFETMRFLSIIVFFSISLVIITPTALWAKFALQSLNVAEESCCESGECCSDQKDEEDQKDDYNSCKSGMCNSSQCIFACFLCPINNTPVKILLYQSTSNNKAIADQFSLSDFSAEFWNPPKLVIG